jgi:nucleoside-diphosphate-sugar epimerase
MDNEKILQVRALNSRILITGASGFIGGHFISLLNQIGVRPFSISGLPLSIGDSNQLLYVDITNKIEIKNVLQEIEPTHVFHLAATKERGDTPESFRHCYDVNLLGTLNLLDACAMLKFLPKIISLGTCEEYGDIPAPYYEWMKESPIGSYSCSKLAATQLVKRFCKSHGIEWVILRPSLAYGPNQGDDMFLASLIRSLISGKMFPMTLGAQLRDYVFIKDVVQSMLLAAFQQEANCQIFNISSGISIRLIDLANKVCDAIGDRSKSLLQPGLLKYRSVEQMDYCANNSKAAKILGWSPQISLDEGLDITISSYIKNAQG